ncbi:MAG: hypothetical protein D6722_20700 [Bacteroidetes bacterium]|nr:MAG: hypothetical protein D6722_20700 [Bacteroidota bacterium]
MMRLFTLFFSLLLISLVACEQIDVVPEPFTHAYAETKCMDPWQDITDEDLAARVQTYLEAQGVTVEDISVDLNTGDAASCEACHCPTGTVIMVKVPDAGSEALEALGFYDLRLIN